MEGSSMNTSQNKSSVQDFKSKLKKNKKLNKSINKSLESTISYEEEKKINYLTNPIEKVINSKDIIL